MKDEKIEQDLIRLGETMRVSLVENVMQRIEHRAGEAQGFESLGVPSHRASSPIPHRSMYLIRALCALAASVAILIFATQWKTRSEPYRKNIVAPPKNSVVVKNDSFPTLADFQRAYAKSPDALDVLLQQSSNSVTARPSMRAGDVLRSDLNLFQ